jgi:acyl-CoA thioester hydrolase
VRLSSPPPSSALTYAPGLVTSKLECTVRVGLRWRDMDMLGHLNQSVYHELLEEARAALITELVRRVGGDLPPGGYVLAHVDLDHHAEVRKDHAEVQIVARLAHVGRSSLRLEHEIRLPNGTLAASGTTVLVAWDPVTRGKRALTQAELAVLS